MKKAIVIIFCTLLFGCSTKIKYENWQVPFEEVDTAYIYNYDDNESQYKEITQEEANQLLKAYNQLDTREEKADGLIGQYNYVRVLFKDGKKECFIGIDLYLFHVSYKEDTMNFMTYNYNQEFFKLLGDLCLKYDIDMPRVFEEDSAGWKFDDGSFCGLGGKAKMKDIFEIQGIEFEEDITLNEFLKKNIEIKLNNTYQYENIIFRITNVVDGDAFNVVAYKE